MVEVGWIGGDAFERAGEVGLEQAIAGFVEIAVALEDAAGLGKFRQVLVVLEGPQFLVAGQITLAGETDRRGHDPGEAQLAEMGLGVGQPGDRPRDARRQAANGRQSGDDVAAAVEVHVGGRGGGSGFAVVQKSGPALVERVVRGADQHEAAAADVARLRQNHGEGEADGHGGIDGVAARAEDFQSGVGGVVVDRDDHGVRGAHGGLAGYGRGRCLRVGGRRQCGGEQGEDGGQTQG